MAYQMERREAPLPHQFVVDMGAAKTINGFAFTNRSNLNGAMKDIEIFKSNDNSTGQVWGLLH